MRRYILILIILLCVNFFSCKKENRYDCFKSTGKVIKEERIPNDFNTIFLYDNINLYITQDTFNKITIEAGENLIDLIKTNITDTILTIRNDNICNWVRDFKKPVNAYVSVKNLKNINYSGSGNITGTNTVTGDFFRLDVFLGSGVLNLSIDVNTSWICLHTGCANINVNGESGVSYVYLNGYGPINAGNLVTVYTFINNKGTNDCYINVTKELGATIEYIGNIYYTGNPSSITTNITGTGELIHL